MLTTAKQRIYALRRAKITKIQTEAKQYKQAFEQKRQNISEKKAKQQKKYKKRAIELAEGNKKMRNKLSKWQPELLKRKKKLAGLKAHYSKFTSSFVTLNFRTNTNEIG